MRSEDEIDFDTIDKIMTEIFNHCPPTTERRKEIARENLRRYPELISLFVVDKDEEV